MTFAGPPLYDMIPDRDNTPPELSADFHWDAPPCEPEVDADGILVIDESAGSPWCPTCHGDLEECEGETYCQFCVSFTLAR